MKPITSSIVPISGMRRDEAGFLTDDALRSIVDGLKSRGIDPTSAETQKSLMKDLSTLLCNVNNQYQYLLQEITDRVRRGSPISEELVVAAKERNIFLLDVIRVSRHLQQQKPFDESKLFIEAWQNQETSDPPQNGIVEQFQIEKRYLDSGRYDLIKEERLSHTVEKNRVANNYLGVYGFLNIVAIGLLIYIAGVSTSSGANGN